MTKHLTCTDAVNLLHELAREELTPMVEQSVEAHLASCAGCTAAYDDVRQSYRVLQAVRHDGLPPGAEARLPSMRAHIMAAIRAEQAPRLSWWQLSFGSAVAAAAFAAITLVSGLAGDTQPRGQSANADTPTIAGPSAPAPVATVAFAKTADGVTLSWAGAEPTYRILRSTKPGRFQEAAVTVVCGNRWTDRESTGSLVYYQVVPTHDRCRS